MRGNAFDIPEVVGSRSLNDHRASAPPVTALPEALRPVAEEPALRARSERLASVLETEMSSGEAATILRDVWLGARTGDRAALRCVASLLEVRQSGLELLQQALRPRQFLRACRRAAAGAEEARSDAWRDVVQAGTAHVQRAGVEPAKLLRAFETLPALEKRTSVLLESLLEQRIKPAELAWLTEMAEIELRATAIRLGHLAEKVGAHDGRRISILLPVLSRQEERIRDTHALLVKLPAPQDLVRRTPVIVQRLETSFEPLLRDVAASGPDGRELAQCLVLLAGRTPLAEELAYGAGVIRSLAERLRSREMSPLDPARALLLALKARRAPGFAIELHPHELRATRAMWEVLGCPAKMGGFLLEYEPRRHRPLLADDGVPELTYPVVKRITDLRQLVIANIQNEHIICGLLALPRLSTLPGLVEQVVMRSRSLKVLLEIANRRELYTGAANRNVPRALLWHPSAVPVSALRKFVHVRFVDRQELAAMCTRGSRARPEVRQLAFEYLQTLSST